jgi:hypothetical protein
MDRYLSPVNIYMQLVHIRPLKKRCRILPVGGLGASPSFKNPSQDWRFRWFIKAITAL